MEIQNEIGVDGVIKIDINDFPTIMKQSQKSLCRIKLNDKKTGTGYFCLIPFPKKITLFQVLMTNNHVLGENDIANGKNINFTINNDEKNINILIDNSRLVYTNSKYDITIIEIKENEIDGIKFLGIHDQLYTDKPSNTFKGISVYIIQYPSGKKAQYSCGKLKIMEDNYTINHECETEPGSSGSPIIDLKSFRVLGIHKGSKENNNHIKWKFNYGIFLKEPIEQFRKECINKYNDKGVKIDKGIKHIINSNDKINNNINDNSKINSEKKANILILNNKNLKEKNDNNINKLSLNAKGKIEEKDKNKFNDFCLFDENKSEVIEKKEEKKIDNNVPIIKKNEEIKI